MGPPPSTQAFTGQLRARWDDQPITKQLGLAAAVIAVGVFFISLATEGAGIAVGLAGFVAVAVGIYKVKDPIRDPVKAQPLGWCIGGLAAIALGCLLIWLALAVAQAWVAAIGSLVVVLGLVPFSAYQRLDTTERGKPTAIAGLLIIVATGVAVAIRGIGVPLLLAVILILLGITVYRTGLTGWLTDDRSVARAAKVGAVGVAAGTILVCLGAQLIDRWLFVLGALPGTLALHLLSVASTSSRAAAWKATRPAWRQWSRWGHVAAGVVVAGTWVVLWTIAQQPFWVATAIALALFSMGASFVWRGESVLIVLLVGFLVVWVTIDRSVAAPEAVPDDTPRIVAIGDSYMSGDGASRFYEHTDVRGSSRNTCRRAPTAYPVLVADALGYGLQFLACSGAETQHLYQAGEGQMTTASDDAPGRLPQLDYVTSIENVEFVLVSIGGNDARFKEVGETCLLPGSCDDIKDEWIENAERLADKMVPAFEAIRARFGEEIPIIVMAYPVMITKEACSDAMVTQGEHEFLLRFVETINEQAQLSAARAGVHFFGAGADAYLGDKLCSDGELSPASVNFISLQPPAGRLFDRLNPAGWLHQSLHPNATGHGRTAAALISWLKSSPPGNNPEPNRQVTLADLGIADRPPPRNLEALPDRDEWKNQQLARAAQQAWPIVVALFLGGWAFAVTSTHGGPFGPSTRPEPDVRFHHPRPRISEPHQ